MTQELRTRIEAAIENLVALLDTIDGDGDLEPSLAAYRTDGGISGEINGEVDLEADYSDFEPEKES